jgi:hypothetical protein
MLTRWRIVSKVILRPFTFTESVHQTNRLLGTFIELEYEVRRKSEPHLLTQPFLYISTCAFQSPHCCVLFLLRTDNRYQHLGRSSILGKRNIEYGNEGVKPGVFQVFQEERGQLNLYELLNFAGSNLKHISSSGFGIEFLGDLMNYIGLNVVALFHIIEIINFDTTLEAGSNFSFIVLESSKGANLS